MMDLSPAGLKFIANHEGVRLYVYDDKTGKPWKDSKKGKPTIGYGHLIQQDKDGRLLEDYPTDTGLFTTEMALNLFKKDLASKINAVRSLVKVKVNQNQFDALVSLVFNIGTGAFGKSTLLRRLNGLDYQGAADHFLDWKYDGAHQPVLLTRRQAERELFLKPM